MTSMLKWFDRVCRENKLRYWVVGGTLIGAIRHKGWIPWDGDLDVNMLYEDFKKFEIIVMKSLPINLVFETPPKKGHKHYKIRDLYSHYYEGHSPSGLMIDIFLVKKEGKILNGDITNTPIFGNPDKRKRKYSDVFPLKELYFEYVKVYVPNKYEKVSKKIWGDFPPKLPEIRKRYPHEGKMNPNEPNEYMLKKYKDIYERNNKLSNI